MIGAFFGFIVVSCVVIILIDNATHATDNKIIQLTSDKIAHPYHSNRVQDTSNEFQRLAVQNIQNQDNLPNNWNSSINDDSRNPDDANQRVPKSGGSKDKSIWGDESIEFTEPMLHKSWLPLFKTRYDPYVLKMAHHMYKKDTPIDKSEYIIPKTSK